MVEVSASILLERILHDALERASTDVHLQVVNHNLDVQFRVQGQLIPFVSVPGHGDSVVRRVKALCRMDVSETRLPQDGSFRYESEAFVSDIRAACLPTITGESLVLRLLPVQPQAVSFASLGMTAPQCSAVQRLLRSTNGLILMAGPTGSGKTTTMYAMMMQLARWGRRVVSIEDPVEGRLSECHQMEVRERLGLTFDTGLKALLRQDPDVIMVGEIRDAATATVVLRASMSGHLVLTTTHATDLVGVATRLVDFGLSRSLIGEILRGVVVQRMERTLCTACSGRGCQACLDGDSLRDGHPMFVVYEVTAAIAQLLGSDLPWHTVRAQLPPMDRNMAVELED